MQNDVTNFSEEDFYVMVHTFQVSVGDNLEWRRTQPKKKYANKQWQNGDRFYYVINPNKFCSELHTFEAFLRVKKAIFEELQLEDYQLNRIDISINCKFEYEELYKLNLYFNSLDAVRCDAQNHYLVIGTDLDKRSIKFATKYYANEIYDKSIESQNRDNAKTRIEMRYKPRTNMDFETAVQETIATLGNLMGFYEKYNKLTIEHLQERYLKEKAELRDGKIGAFTEFVSRYYYMFTNMKILNGLYRLNMKGTCKSWLYKYRKGNRTLMLYPKSAISAYIAVLKKAVEHYCKM